MTTCWDWIRNVDILEYRLRLKRKKIVQDAYDNHRIIPLDIGLSSNLFPYNTDDGIHNYVYWGSTWDISESEILNILPPNLDVVTYINPPELRSMKNKPHRNVFLREARGNKDLPIHVLPWQSTPISTNRYIKYWTLDDIENMWEHPCLERWKTFRTSDLTRLAILLMEGGTVFKGNVDILPYNYTSGIRYNTDKISDWTIIENDSYIDSTRFDPIIFEYMNYVTGLSYSDRIPDTITTRSFYNFYFFLQPWEKMMINFGQI